MTTEPSRQISDIQEPNDLFDRLILRTQNHLIICKIFLYLDPLSMKTASQVNHLWNQCIQQHIWKSAHGKGAMKTRLDQRWSHAEPKSKKILCSGMVFDIKADPKNIVCSLDNGSIEIWDRKSMELVTTLNGGNDHVVFVNLHATVLVSGFFDRSFHVWDRETFTMVQVVELDSNIYSIKGTGNTVIVSQVDGTVKTFAIDPHPSTQDSPRIQLQFTFCNSVRAVNHIDCDGSWLLCGMHKRHMKLYSLETGTIQQSLSSRSLRIARVHLSYPLAAIHAWHRDSEQLLLWDVATMIQVGHFDTALDIVAVGLNNERLVLSTTANLFHMPVKRLQESSNNNNDKLDMKKCFGPAVSNKLESRTLIIDHKHLIYPDDSGVTVRVQDYWYGNLNFDDQTETGRSNSMDDSANYNPEEHYNRWFWWRAVSATHSAFTYLVSAMYNILIPNFFNRR